MATLITVSIIGMDSSVAESLAGLRASPAIRVLAVYPGIDAAVKKLPLDPPAILLVDFALPHGSVIAATHWFKAKIKRLKIGLLTGDENPDLVFQAFKAGADAWFLKEESSEQLAAGIQELYRDGPVISRAAAKCLAFQFQKRRRIPSSLETLSIRELEVVLYLAHGCSDKEIARVLQIALTTVNDHLKRIYRKFGVHSRAEAVAKYWSLGLGVKDRP